MVIVGAGHLGKHILDQLITETKREEIVFFDEFLESTSWIYNKYPIINQIDDLSVYFKDVSPYFIGAIGQSRLRKKLVEKVEKAGGTLVSNISKQANISPFCKYEDGLFIQPGAGISHESVIGRSCVIHSNATISHKVYMGDYVSVGPNVSIIGSCEIGGLCFIGANAVILPDIKIGRNVIVPAGAVVNRDLKDNETFIF